MSKRWRNSREYRRWRAKVIRRDKVCQICGIRQKREAHHIESAAYNKDKRFTVDNGITLCATCHRHLFHSMFKGGNRKKATRKDLKHFTKIANHYMEVKNA